MPVLEQRRCRMPLGMLFAIASFTLAAQPRQVWPAGGWTRATPQSQGISAARFAELDREVESGVYGRIL